MYEYFILNYLVVVFRVGGKKFFGQIFGELQATNIFVQLCKNVCS